MRKTIICKECGKEVTKHHCKGLCHTCYSRKRYRADPELRKKHNIRVRKYKQNKSRTDPDWCERKRKQEREYCKSIKRQVIEAYGGKCECCGEIGFEFLTIDHINGRESGDRRRGKHLYLYLKKLGWPQDRFRLLCFNCNAARGQWGYCPHEGPENGKETEEETDTKT